jgi:hypothetical protein
MAAKKASTPASRAKSRVASRAKGQARAAASKTSAKQDRAAAGRAYSKPGKMLTGSAGSLPVAAARLAIEAGKKINRTKEAAARGDAKRFGGSVSKPKPAKTTSKWQHASETWKGRETAQAARAARQKRERGSRPYWGQ